MGIGKRSFFILWKEGNDSGSTNSEKSLFLKLYGIQGYAYVLYLVIFSTLTCMLFNFCIQPFSRSGLARILGVGRTTDMHTDSGLTNS